jgi:hypothetical protein
VTTPDVRIPAAASLQKHLIPGAEAIADTVRQLVGRT